MKVKAHVKAGSFVNGANGTVNGTLNPILH
jgi:hypothetical protein